MLGALSLMEFRAYLKMCHQQAEKLPTLTDSALCLTRNNRVLLEGSGEIEDFADWLQQPAKGE